MKHENLREKCAELRMRLLQRDGNPIDKIESFAREIRNEALEEAANELCGAAPGLCIEELCEAKRVRALKDSK